MLPRAAYKNSAKRDALLAGLIKARPDWYSAEAIGMQLPKLAESLTPSALQSLFT